MDKRLLQTYSVWAKENLERQIEISLKTLGINGDKDIKPARRVGDFTVIEGDPASYPASLYDKRRKIEDLIRADGYRHVIEEFAYTWFNRIIALRFMEVHDFLDHGFRVLSNRSGGVEPEILKNIGLVKNDLGLDADRCGKLRDEGKIEELFRYVLLKQCNALSGILPMLFSKDEDHLELLLPKMLLRGETVVTKLLEIPEENFLNDVEIIGWMYQFYNSDKKDEVFAAKKTITKDTLPAVTQLFTPDWIVRYMAQNSVGRIWMESYPDSPLRAEMKYYVDDPEQPEEVQRKLAEIRYRNVNPEDICIIEPCCGSGHILVYVFDLLYKMYEEKGYQKRDIPTLILQKNLTGLDVDRRAAQLAAFSLVMKARSVNNRFFHAQYYVIPRVYEFYDSHTLEMMDYRRKLKETGVISEGDLHEFTRLVDTFRNGKTIGSLLKVKPMELARLREAIARIENEAVSSVFLLDFLQNGLPVIKRLITLAEVLSSKYDVMITNPPYIGTSSMEAVVKEYAVKEYPNSKTDMFAMFMETGFVRMNGFTAMINMHSWMFLSSYENLRKSILLNREIVNMIHLGARAFESIGGEVVQTTSFVLRNKNLGGNGVYFRLVDSTDKEKDFMNSLLTGGGHFIVDALRFNNIPGLLFAYWVSNASIGNFKNKSLSDVMVTREGMATADNNTFLRLWFEVNITNAFLDATDSIQAVYSGKRWFPYHKGGEYRKWYGNNEYFVDWYLDGKKIKNNIDPKTKRVRSHNYNGVYAFQEGLTWSAISSDFSLRYAKNGFLFDSKGAKGFPINKKDIWFIAGLLNSVITKHYLSYLSPTLDFKVGDIIQIPFVNEQEEIVNQLASQNVDESKEDWDAFETSWDFKKHPLL